MRRSHLIGLLAALLISTASVRASDVPVAEQRIAIDFKGGTVADYLNSIQDSIGVRNIMLTDGLEDIQMAPVALTAVRYADAVALVRHLPVPTGHMRVTTEGSTFVIWAERDTRQAVRDETLVRSLSEMLAIELYTADEVLGAIEAALAAGQIGGVDLRYHEATTLLIARGDRDALRTIEQAIDNLENASASARRGNTTPDPESKELRRMLEGMHQQNRDLRIEMDSVQRTLRNEITLLEDERAQLRDQLLMVEREFAIQKAVMQKEIDDLRAAAGETSSR
ncbi:MAG: hypothetical protein AAFX05_04320 [Planctomycetota bacterium]